MPARDLLHVDCEKLRPTPICLQESITLGLDASPTFFAFLLFLTVHQAYGIVDNLLTIKLVAIFNRGCLCGFRCGISTFLPTVLSRLATKDTMNNVTVLYYKKYKYLAIYPCNL